jgi:rfaE bifunctional protein nucleotidyltransferase chain/domain
MARMSALAAARVAAPSTVLCHGVFDVLHIGHKRHLEEARSLGDRLVVSITADEHVNKGPGRPVFTAEQRKEMLLALDCVDDVIIAPGPTAKASIEQVRPAVYVKGIDYRDTENPHHLDDVQAVEAMGGRCVITASDKWSSSRIINGERLSDEALAYLDRVRDRGWFPQIQQAFAAADRLNILFVGETIIDEYRYVQALAKPSKEFILATVEAREPEQFLGGVVAAGLHADWANVKVVSDDGEPIKKTRFVDADFGRKLFEVYSRPTLALDDMQRLRFQDRLERDLRWAGVVIVLDFGHGLMTEGDRIALTSSHRFVAVNAQTNAGNNGFNPVTKYRRADLVCVAHRLRRPDRRRLRGRADQGPVHLAGGNEQQLIDIFKDIGPKTGCCAHGAQHYHCAAQGRAAGAVTQSIMTAAPLRCASRRIGFCRRPLSAAFARLPRGWAGRSRSAGQGARACASSGI